MKSFLQEDAEAFKKLPLRSQDEVTAAFRPASLTSQRDPIPIDCLIDRLSSATFPSSIKRDPGQNSLTAY